MLPKQALSSGTKTSSPPPPSLSNKGEFTHYGLRPPAVPPAMDEGRRKGGAAGKAWRLGFGDKGRRRHGCLGRGGVRLEPSHDLRPRRGGEEPRSLVLVVTESGRRLGMGFIIRVGRGSGIYIMGFLLGRAPACLRAGQHGNFGQLPIANLNFTESHLARPEPITMEEVGGGWGRERLVASVCIRRHGDWGESIYRV